jgi:hypothetical protein
MKISENPMESELVSWTSSAGQKWWWPTPRAAANPNAKEPAVPDLSSRTSPNALYDANLRMSVTDKNLEPPARLQFLTGWQTAKQLGST